MSRPFSLGKGSPSQEYATTPEPWWTRFVNDPEGFRAEKDRQQARIRNTRLGQLLNPLATSTGAGAPVKVPRIRG